MAAQREGILRGTLYVTPFLQGLPDALEDSLHLLVSRVTIFVREENLGDSAVCHARRVLEGEGEDVSVGLMSGGSWDSAAGKTVELVADLKNRLSQLFELGFDRLRKIDW